MMKNGFDATCGKIIGGEFDVYDYYYNGTLCDSRPFRSESDAIAFYTLTEKTAIAKLLGHVAPQVVNRATERAIAA